jgi:hypothetical protein
MAVQGEAAGEVSLSNGTVRAKQGSSLVWSRCLQGEGLLALLILSCLSPSVLQRTFDGFYSTDDVSLAFAR